MQPRCRLCQSEKRCLLCDHVVSRTPLFFSAAIVCLDNSTANRTENLLCALPTHCLIFVWTWISHWCTGFVSGERGTTVQEMGAKTRCGVRCVFWWWAGFLLRVCSAQYDQYRYSHDSAGPGIQTHRATTAVNFANDQTEPDRLMATPDCNLASSYLCLFFLVPYFNTLSDQT